MRVRKKEKVSYAKPNQKCESRIRKVLAAREGAVRYCFDKHRYINNSRSGRIKIQFQILRDDVSLVFLEDTIQSDEVQSCLREKVKDWDFGPDCYETTFQKEYSIK